MLSALEGLGAELDLTEEYEKNIAQGWFPVCDIFDLCLFHMGIG